jgi:uncharacterized membrane protein HdeD (DUF308 family)
MTYEASYPHDAAATIRSNSGWFLALGIIFIIGGAVAIAAPFIATVFVTAFIGVSLAIVGIMQIVQAWQMRSWTGFAWQLIMGLVILAGGLAIWWNPFVGALTLTLFVAVMFIAKGVFQVMLGLRLRPHEGSGWIIAAGVIALLVGVLIFFQWPFSALYLLGTLAGISLIISGWSYVMIALAARRATA